MQTEQFYSLKKDKHWDCRIHSLLLRISILDNGFMKIQEKFIVNGKVIVI